MHGTIAEFVRHREFATDRHSALADGSPADRVVSRWPRRCRPWFANLSQPSADTLLYHWLCTGASAHDTVPYHPCSLVSHFPEVEAAMTLCWHAPDASLLQASVSSPDDAAAQPAKPACTSAQTALGTQTLRCETAITIVSENGAKFELRDRNRDGQVDSVELSNKALLLEVPKKPGAQSVRGGDAAGDRRGARHQMGGGCRRWQDVRVRRRRPCQRRARSSAAAGSISVPARVSMSRRRANWSSSAGRPRASQP